MLRYFFGCDYCLNHHLVTKHEIAICLDVSRFNSLSGLLNGFRSMGFVHLAPRVRHAIP